MGEWNNKTFFEAFETFDEGRKSRHSNCYIHKFDGVDFFMQQDLSNADNLRIVAMRFSKNGLILYDRQAMVTFTDRMKDVRELEAYDRKHYIPLTHLEESIPDITRARIVDSVNDNHLIQFDNKYILIFWRPGGAHLDKSSFKCQILDPAAYPWTVTEKKYIEIKGTPVSVSDAIDHLIPEREGVYANGLWLAKEDANFQVPCLTEAEQEHITEGIPLPQQFGITHPDLVKESSALSLIRLDVELDALSDEPEELYLRTHMADELRAYLLHKEAYNKAVISYNRLTKTEAVIGKLIKPLWVGDTPLPEAVSKSSVTLAKDRWSRDVYTTTNVYIRGTWGVALQNGNESSILSMRLDEWHEVTNAEGFAAYKQRV